MRSNIFRCTILLWTILLYSNCQQSIDVGSDLLKDEKILIGYSADFPMKTITLDTHRIITYYKGIDNQTYMVGHLKDSDFGSVQSDLFLTFQMGSTKANYGDILEPKQFDSLVLLLQFDSLGFYPNKNLAYQHIDIFQIKSAFPESDSVYSNIDIPLEDLPIFSRDMKLNNLDSIYVTSRDSNKLVKLSPHFRARLDDEFGKSIFENAAAAESDTEFSTLFRGLCIKTNNNSNSFIGFNFNDASLSGARFTNKLVLYYTVSDTVKREYTYFLNSKTINTILHDKQSSKLSMALKDTLISSMESYIEGLGGSNTKVLFDDLSLLKTKIINQVILEFSVADLSTSLGYSPPTQILALREKDGKMVFIEDFNRIIGSGLTAVKNILGGNPEIQSDGTSVYKINITNHIKSYLSGDISDPSIILSTSNSSENPKKAIIYGPHHATKPMKLRIIYTEK
ncbi:MAG: DUF4270 family protein [Lewinellaceae bacterium]|nr:DUF4270 family protein [Lewinellaceae bacterium]